MHMPVRARRLPLMFLAAALGPLLALCAALLAYDPLQIFHAPRWRAATLHENMRWQALGVIRRQPFDSLILGTSVFENSSADEAGRLLGGRFVNLSVSAGDFFERSLILDYALRHRRIDQVVYSLDYIYLNQRIGYRVFPLPTYDYLYDGNRLNDIRVYLNRHFLACLATWSAERTCIGRVATLDRPNAWMHDPRHAARFGGIERWCAARQDDQIKDVLGKLREARFRIERAGPTRGTPQEVAVRTARAIDYVDRHLLRLVRAHPETRFHLVFPPYYRAKFALLYQDQQIDATVHGAVVRHLAEAASSLGNLAVFGFEDQDLPDDIARYKDMDHFDPAANSMILHAIAAGTHRLRVDNVDAYLAEAARRGARYDLRALLARLSACGS